MQQNATAAGAPPRTRWGSLQRSPRALAGFKGREGEGRGGEGKGKRGTGKEGKEREGEIDSDAQLEQGRRLAKAGLLAERYHMSVLSGHLPTSSNFLSALAQKSPIMVDLIWRVQALRV